MAVSYYAHNFPIFRDVNVTITGWPQINFDRIFGYDQREEETPFFEKEK